MKKKAKKKREFVWLEADCTDCPYPHLRDRDMCGICSNLCRNMETGERFVSVKPVIEEEK